MYLDLLLIHLIIVFILDISGFVEDGIQPFFIKHFKHRLRSKPWTCDMCQTLWVGIIYLLITSQFTILNLSFVFLLSYLSPVTNNLMLAIREALLKITNLI